MAVTTPNYEIDPNDERLTTVTTEKNQALTANDKMYNDMLSAGSEKYEDAVDGVNDWAAEQKKLQQQQTDFAIEQIEQQKAQAEKDYQKEASAAYVDYKKQSNPYGVEAEQRAAMGMTNTGYSESSLVSMYNQYQIRYTAAREIYQKALMNYNNAITEAKLKNSSILAEIAYEALQKETELTLQWMQFENTLLLDKADQKLQIMQLYDNKYQNVLDQINKENALAEEVRQYNASLAEEQRQFNATNALQQAQLQLQRDQFNYQKAQNAAKSATISKSSSGSSSSSKKSSSSSKKSSSSKSSSGGSAKVSSKAAGAVVGQKSSSSSSSSSKKTSSSSPTIDMSSVLALGYGPISAKKLNELVSSGKVKQYTENGKIKFKKVFAY